MYFYDKEAVQTRLAEVAEQAERTDGRNQAILKAFLAYCTDEQAYTNKMIEELHEAIWPRGTQRMSEIFSESDNQVLEILLGTEWAEKFKTIWDRSTDYIYLSGWGRRSFRTKTMEEKYLYLGVANLVALFELVAMHFSYETYFSRWESSILVPTGVIADLLAMEIDRGNVMILNQIHETIFGDNNTGRITREIIKGLLMSHQSIAHQWVGDLLLAAKLQEGLRQVIVESMDEGSREGFLYMLRLILDHDLTRFSSVVRALDVWTGLGIGAQKPMVIKKCLQTAYRCLTEPDYIAECVTSDDALQIYMGLWAIAFDEITATEQPLRQLLAAPEKYKRLVALYFLKETQFPFLQHRLATPLLGEPDYEVKYWVLENMFPNLNRLSLQLNNRGRLHSYKEMDGINCFAELYTELKHALDNMPKKEIIFKESVFPWNQVTLTYDQILEKIFLVVVEESSPEIVDTLLDYKGRMSADMRSIFLENFLSNPKTVKQKTAIVEFMGDRSEYVRAAAARLVEKLTLCTEDYQIIEDLLRYKAGDMRKNAIIVLIRQSPEGLLTSLKRLYTSNNEQQTLALLEIIAAIENAPTFATIQDECHTLAHSIAEREKEAKTSQKVWELAKRFISNDLPQYTAANGFGLYDPQQQVTLPVITSPEGFSPKTILSTDLREIQQILQGFSDRIDQYKDYEYEYEYWDGSRKKVILGSEDNFRIRWYSPGGPSITLDDYPLAHIWRETAGDFNLTASKILEILFYYCCYHNDQICTQTKWYSLLLTDLFQIDLAQIKKWLGSLPFRFFIESILNHLLDELPRAEIFHRCYEMGCYFYESTPPKYFQEEYEEKYPKLPYQQLYKGVLFGAEETSFWFTNMKKAMDCDEGFQKWFQLSYTFYQDSGYRVLGNLQLADFEKAFQFGLLPESELYAELCGRLSSYHHLGSLTEGERAESLPKLAEVCQKVVNRIVTIELQRGEMPTEVSHLASRIHKFVGTRFFIDIVVGTEKDTYVRGYNFLHGDNTKRQMFSHLLKCCYPADGEDENTLRAILQGRKVSAKQLIDAAMYTPQWVEMVEKALNWPGLKSACWYFHAHVNESFSVEKETIVARYSPISPHDFQNGAFDLNWFREAYTTLGEERFQIVYDSAKYIAGGALHKRAQLFADAVLGKMDLQRAEEVIREKRNKDYVLCYGLIPLYHGKSELLHRYQVLQTFLKESKQFGAQRRESEAKVVAIALDNLARNAGFADVIRFTWYMETETIRAMGRYLNPTIIGDIEVQICIDEHGKASMRVAKEGKVRKDVPSALKNHPYIKEMKVALKMLKDQHTRARASLERAMELGDEFKTDELQNLTENPVLYPLMNNLVFRCGDKLGFFRDMGLVDPQQRRYELQMEDRCMIAHPVHLYQSGEWATYQRDVYEHQRIQPFKQIFRELYRPNRDELEGVSTTSRYAGYQIQPQKTVGLLKGRGWTASYNEGLQKVYYKENVIAEVYALADWFSPADVEAPTIEEVCFMDRNTGKRMAFKDVPPLIFSEVMRDIDLVVSVAHVGGVDPEASLSTIEMRTVLMAELLRLLKLTNVELKGSHAIIQGTLGRYTVHLGSGIVHKMAKGAISILPVHSQHRGRIFLPFIDDDPRTAEIVSKVVLLAEDQKIKDPTVLEQIV